jgi:hypothetical protein
MKSTTIALAAGTAVAGAALSLRALMRHQATAALPAPTPNLSLRVPGFPVLERVDLLGADRRAEVGAVQLDSAPTRPRCGSSYTVSTPICSFSQSQASLFIHPRLAPYSRSCITANLSAAVSIHD